MFELTCLALAILHDRQVQPLAAITGIFHFQTLRRHVIRNGHFWKNFRPKNHHLPTILKVAGWFYSTDVRHERFWRVGIARNAVFFNSFVASKVRKGRSEKRGGAKDRLPKMSTKFAPRLRARAIWKSKSLETGRIRALLEVELRKLCTTPAHESDLEVKIVKSWHAGSTFGS